MEYIKLATISMIPVIELRGAIPIGISLGLNPLYVYTSCVLGSTLISILLITSFRNILQALKNHKTLHKIGHKVDVKINSRMKKMRSISIFGIFVFVAIPLPTTGSWTAAAIASTLRMRIKDALIGIFLGNIISGMIVSVISVGII